jgi:hypothetical protein
MKILKFINSDYGYVFDSLINYDKLLINNYNANILEDMQIYISNKIYPIKFNIIIATKKFFNM